MKKFPIVAVFGFLLIQGTCSDDESPDVEPIPVELTVTSVSPASGKKGTSVEIVGTGFGPSIFESKVTFNGKDATITSATDTKLIVEVPAKAGTGQIVVTSSNKTANGPTFKYLFTTTVTTFAGSESGYADGLATAAKFKGPNGLAFDDAGNLYVADRSDNRIRKVTPDGVVNTVAGTGTGGHMDGHIGLAEFLVPSAVAIDKDGNIFVADKMYNFIRKITPAGWVSTFAGSGFNGYKNDTGTKAILNNPCGLAIDPSNNLFVLEEQNNTIRKISPDAVVTTFSGIPHNYAPAFLDGIGTVARFNQASSIELDKDGNIIVADRSNNRIRKVAPDGTVTTIAGNGEEGNVDGQAMSAKFYLPSGVGIAADGTIYVTDERNNSIRAISTEGEVTTLAGNGTAGDVVGDGAEARFNNPRDIIVDKNGNIFVADYLNSKIKKIVLD